MSDRTETPPVRNSVFATMTRNERAVWSWHVRLYGEGVDLPATYRKLLEEVGELGEAMMAHSPDSPQVREEMADVISLAFVLSVGLYTPGIDALLGEINHKLTERHGRSPWSPPRA